MKIEMTEKQLNECVIELKKGKVMKIESSNDEILFLKLKNGE